MNGCKRWCGWKLVVILLPWLAMSPARLQAQEQHVVTSQDLSKDTTGPRETRGSNEAAVRELFSSEQAQRALQSASIDYRKVDKAIDQLSDEDLSKLAARSRQAQDNFSGGRAGSLSDRDLLIILIIAILIIALVAVLR
ncbi:MAG TPA: hypothetical protein VKQ28_09785 [Candidatus Acidoferrum sp.]|nr:hypothetical protein [Candidatus Acidoferrum sp.]